MYFFTDVTFYHLLLLYDQAFPPFRALADLAPRGLTRRNSHGTNRDD